MGHLIGMTLILIPIQHDIVLCYLFYSGRKYAMLKLKILLSTIIRNFKVTSGVQEEDFQLQGDIILKRADGFRIKLEKR